MSKFHATWFQWSEIPVPQNWLASLLGIKPRTVSSVIRCSVTFEYLGNELLITPHDAVMDMGLQVEQIGEHAGDYLSGEGVEFDGTN